MNKLSINVLEKNNYGFTLKGSKALKLLMDQNTPPIDLLVRESIQNSSDATLKNKKCCRIYFNNGTFKTNQLADKLDLIGDNLCKRYPNSEYSYLIIKDTNTVGLLGDPNDEKGPDNNLYKLVYSFLESGKDSDSGGSWGIGKSVYYRFGIGMVFYYSKTFENGTFNEKLCGAIIEDEEDKRALLRDNCKSTGIAFFGRNISSNGTERSIPIYDHEFIEEFLNIFELNPFKENETGTAIIIPFFDESQCSSNFTNDEIKFWKDDFISSLKISIQRWYFPKINNEELAEFGNNTFIKVFINGIKLELNPFFKEMQLLYLNKIDGCECEDILPNKGYSGKLGHFIFKKFTNEELSIKVHPENLPSPYAFLDIKNSDEKNDAIVFYTRKPGMIITYEDSNSFTSLTTEEGEYLIGIFVLNDNCTLEHEKLGEYFKECESANHKKWIDINSSKKLKYIPSQKTKPFRKIQNEIKKILNNRYLKTLDTDNVTTNFALQRRLAELLLPPEDFGIEPSIPHKKGSGKRGVLGDLRKSSRTSSSFEGFVDGKPCYNFMVQLNLGEQFITRLMVNTSTKKYNFIEWDNMDFVLPCYINNLSILEYEVNKLHFNSAFKIDLYSENHNTKFVKYDGAKNPIFEIHIADTEKSKKAFEIRILNFSEASLKISFNIVLEPVDETGSFSILRSLTKFSGGNQ